MTIDPLPTLITFTYHSAQTVDITRPVMNYILGMLVQQGMAKKKSQIKCINELLKRNQKVQIDEPGLQKC